MSDTLRTLVLIGFNVHANWLAGQLILSRVVLRKHSEGHRRSQSDIGDIALALCVEAEKGMLFVGGVEDDGVGFGFNVDNKLASFGTRLSHLLNHDQNTTSE